MSALVCLMMAMTAAPAPATPAPHPSYACAHRGDIKAFPENTVEAFASAVRKGAHMIEFDVQLSKDGHAVLMHDASVDRTTNGSGKVADLTFDQLRALDAGVKRGAQFAGLKIPTLEEALECIPHTILCNIHLKGNAEVGKVAAEIVKRMNRLDHCFLAVSAEQAEKAKAVAPEIRLCNMNRQGPDDNAYVQDTIARKTEFIQLLGAMEKLPEAVKQCHEASIKVNYFGASEPEKIKACIQAGVDYILTDDLDVCLSTLETCCGVKSVKPTP